MKEKLLVILLSLVMLVPVGAWAQGGITVDRYTADDGLLHTTVYSAMKDRDGFLWLGTWYGLCSFDGQDFYPYVTRRDTQSDIPPRKVLKVVEDKADNLWIRTTDNRLYRFDKTTERFHDMYAELRKVAANLRVIKVQAIGNGRILLLTRDKSLYEAGVDKDRVAFVHQIYNSKNDVDAATMRLRHNVVGETDSYIYWLGPNYEIAAVGKGTKKRLLPAIGKSATCFTHAGSRVYVGTAEGVAYAIDAGGKSAARITLPAQKAAITTIVPQGKNVYLTTPHGIYVAVGAQTTARQVSQTAAVSSQTIARQLNNAPTDALTAYADKGGQLWLSGKDGGLTQYDTRTNKRTYYPTPGRQTLDAVKFCDAGSNGLFILLRNGNVWRYDRASARMENINTHIRFPRENTQGGDFHDISIDNEGLVWLSSISDGLMKVSFPASYFHSLFKDVLSADVSYADDNGYGIRSLYQSPGGDLWISTRRGNVYCVDPRTGIMKKQLGNAFGNVYHITQDSRGRLWLASKGGGLIMGVADASQPQGMRFTVFKHNAKDRLSISHDYVYYTFEDRSHRIWVCTYGGGLNLVQESGGRITFINRNNQLRQYPHRDIYLNTRCITEDKTGRLWLATTDGLITFDGRFTSPAAIAFDTFRGADNPLLVDNDITSVFTDSRGDLWLSIFGSGLYMMKSYDASTRKPDLTQFSADERQVNMVSTICEDHDGNVWMTTDNTVAYIPPSRDHAHFYGRHVGFPQTEVAENSSLCLSDGTVLIGSRQGVIAFNPRTLISDRRQYRTFITGMRVQNRNLLSYEPQISDISPYYAREITLTHDQNMFTIEFAAPNFTDRGHLTYTYILDGYEKQWHNNGTYKIASYANVPPGEYTFRVRVMYGNSPECTLRITVLPPWWATWWAYTLYILLALLALYGGVRLALYMIRMRNEVYINDRLAELKIRFFTNISHELRTPLSLIKSPIEALRRDGHLSPEGKEYLSLIDSNADKMLHLVNQILDFRKVQNGKMPLRVSYTDLRDTLQLFQREYRMRAQERDIAFELRLPESPLMLWCDTEKIGVVVNNLINNAFKYTDNGGRITVSASQDRESQRCLITVADDGASIPEHQLETIFERFSQAKNMTADDAPQTGTGIGLELSREYVTMHHGRIWAENVKTGGAAFYVLLPTEKDNFQNDAVEYRMDDSTAGVHPIEERGEGREEREMSRLSRASNEISPLTGADDAHGGGGGVLVLVEDNADLRRLLQMQLSKQYHVVTAVDGVDGLQKIREAHPDLIITDIMMPRMNGVEMTRRVRADFSVSHVPVIALTAKTGDDDKLEAITTGVNAYITKPFSNALLMARIAQLIEEQRVFQRKMMLQSESQEQHTTAARERDEYGQHLAEKDLAFVRRIHDIIEQNMTAPDFNIDTIAGEIGLSRSAFFKKLKSLTGFAPVDLVRETRLVKAERLITTTDKSVAEIAYAVGFKDSSYFGKCFKKRFGMTPVEYRNK